MKARSTVSFVQRGIMVRSTETGPKTLLGPDPASHIRIGEWAGTFAYLNRRRKRSVGESPLSYSFDWRRHEHAQVTALLMRDRAKGVPWRILRWVFILLLALSTTVAIGSGLQGDVGSAVQLGLLTVVVGVFALQFPEITGWIQAWRVARADPNVGHPISHALTATGLEVVMKTLTAELRWSGMYAVKETNSMFLFYYSKWHAYYLPKRAIQGDEALARVRERVSSELPQDVPFH